MVVLAVAVVQDIMAVAEVEVMAAEAAAQEEEVRITEEQIRQIPRGFRQDQVKLLLLLQATLLQPTAMIQMRMHIPVRQPGLASTEETEATIIIVTDYPLQSQTTSSYPIL
jgi:hypothetical protein